MKFDSSLLKEQSANNISISKSTSNDNASFIYDLLEYNDEMHRLDVEEKINYYRCLAESATGASTDLVLSEGIVSGVISFITGAIQLIIDLFAKLINFFRGRKNTADIKRAKTAEKDFDSIKHQIDPKSPLNGQKKFTIYVYPNPDTIDDGKFVASFKNLTDNLTALIDGKEIDRSIIEGSREFAYKTLSKNIERTRNNYTNPVTDSASFRESVLSDSCYTFQQSMQIKEYLEKYRPKYIEDADIMGKKLKSIIATLERNKSTLIHASPAMDPNKRELANIIVKYCDQICGDLRWYFTTISNYSYRETAYYGKLYDSMKNAPVSESGMIHGEEFNGETLFDNDDIRDFNRTEWLDLELTTECYEISSAILEYRRNKALQEAMILSENGHDTFAKLMAMQEAEVGKLGNRFSEIIQNIIDQVNKFFTNLKDKLSLNVQFIKKNQDIIQKPVKLTNIKSTGDIVRAIGRINKVTPVAQYNYEAMKDTLDKEKEFFDKHILAKWSDKTLREGVSWTDDSFSVSELCKAYFGASMPEEKAPLVSLDPATLNTPDIISFLKAPNAMISNIKNELNQIKSQAKKAAEEEARKTAESQNQNTNNTTGGTPKNNDGAENPPNGSQAKTESVYYSELYNRCFTEAPQYDSPAVDNNSQNNEVIKAAMKETKGGFKTYVKAYRSVILAKITGASFVRNEFMALMKAHVKSYDPKRAVDQGAVNNAENENQPAQSATSENQ